MVKQKLSYFEKLKDPRWQKKRLKILQRANFQCEICQGLYGTELPLHVHHGYYEKGRNPWDYPDETLWCLCEECHKITQDDILLLYKSIAKLWPGDIDSLREFVQFAINLKPCEMWQIQKEYYKKNVETVY